MKTVIAFLILVLTSTKTFALNDLERAVLFGANATSFGTFLPDIEGRIAELNLEFEKKKAELRLRYEQNRRELLKSSLRSEISLSEKQIEVLREQQSILTERSKSFVVTVHFAQTLFQQVVYRQEVLKEIQEQMKIDPEFQGNWQGLLQTAGTEDAEIVLLKALEVQAQFDGMEYSLQTRIEDLQMDIEKIKEKLGAL